ncbi:PAS domain S-box protein [Paractinoplanes globisporus]|uniref:histidine kinase n=1 Tax=Paractinoplanes globisporus TaxID=113565 RepID=A0ABW6WVV9_9ACTN|nr:PAS domain S-box protein [Actinoplanes globisporus]
MTVGYLDRPAESETPFGSLFDASPLGMAVFGPEGTVLRANTALSTLLGREPHELEGREFVKIAHPDDRRLLDNDNKQQRHVRLMHADGRPVPCLIAVTPLADGRRIAQIVDRTEAVATRDRLLRSEQQFRTAFDVSPIPSAIAGEDGRIQQINPAFSALLGRGDLVGRHFGDLTHPADRPVSEREVSKVVADPDAAAGFDKRYLRPDGTVVWARVGLTTIPGPDGTRLRFVQCEDITARKLAEEAAAREAERLRVTVAAERSARADLARSEEQFRTAFDGCPIGLLVADEHGRFQRANPAAAALTGRSREELAGLTHREITDPADLEAATHARLALLRGAGEVCYDKRLLRPDGSIAWTRVTLSLIPGPAGRRWRLVQLQDISAERAAAAASQRELRRLRATLAVQREVTAAAGVRDDALRVVAERAVEIFDAADGSAVELVDGDTLYYQATAGALAAAIGTRVRIAGSLSGRVLTSDAPAHCADTADDPRVDRAACERLGIGSMLIAPLHAENRVIGCLKISAARPGVFDDTDEQQLALLADSLSSALRHAGDAERNAELLAERTRALAALEASETRFRLAFENSPLGLTLIDMSEAGRGRYLQVNPAMSEITGYRPDELLTMTYKDLIIPEDIPTDAVVREVVAAGIGAYRLELRYRHKDGHAVWVALAGAPVTDECGRPMYVVSLVEDITEKRAADTELRRQARLLELIPAAVIVRDVGGAIRWWNAGAEALYGWPLPAVAGKNVHRLLGTAYPAGGSEIDVLNGLTRDGHWDGQVEHFTGTGRVVTVLSRQVLHRPGSGADPQVLEINTDVTGARAAEKALAESEQRFRAQFANSAAGQVIRSLDGLPPQVNPAYAAMLGYTPAEMAELPDTDLLDPDDFADIKREVAGLFAGDAASYTREGRLRHKDGHWVDVAATVSLVRDESGRPKNVIAVVTDISARRAAENARDQAAAALAERNQELEAANQLKLDLIGMLGHEIGNPLSSIRGYAEVLTEGVDDPSRDRAVGAITRQAGRLDEIVREVLAMVSIDAGTITAARQELSLRAEVERALSAMDLDQLPVTGPDLRVLFHPGHLQQILVNLLSNAGKYGGGATAVVLTCPGTGSAQVAVEDDGPGVPEEFRPHLFERMSRADRDAASVKGTGLGLFIVQGLAHANHADIRHEPKSGGGSRFVVTLQTTRSATD